MTYSELLLSEEWAKRRKHILERDLFRCSNCSNEKLSQSLKKGIAVFQYDKNLIVIDLTLNKNRLLLISDKFSSTLNTPSFILFSENERWVSIMGQRKLTSSENTHYSHNEIAELVRSSELQERGKNLSIAKSLRAELKQLIEKPITELKIELSDCHWIVVYGLHVHHKYYQVDKLPWEYPDLAITTLCWQCHEDLHKNTTVPYLDVNGNKFENLKPCKRCFGAGWFPEYNHVQNGICFRCNGAKYEELM